MTDRTMTLQSEDGTEVDVTMRFFDDLNVDEDTFKGFDCEELRKQFGEVCDKDDWKMPIRCEVPGEKVSMTCAAIEFMTGSVPSVSSRKFNWLVTAEGYYAACGA